MKSDCTAMCGVMNIIGKQSCGELAVCMSISCWEELLVFVFPEGVLYYP